MAVSKTCGDVAVFGSLYEGSCYFGSIPGAPDFWKHTISSKEPALQVSDPAVCCVPVVRRKAKLADPITSPDPKGPKHPDTGYLGFRYSESQQWV